MSSGRSLSENAMYAFADLLTRDTRLFKAVEVLVGEGGLLRSQITEIEEAHRRSGWINKAEEARARQCRSLLRKLGHEFAEVCKKVKHEAYAGGL